MIMMKKLLVSLTLLVVSVLGVLMFDGGCSIETAPTCKLGQCRDESGQCYNPGPDGVCHSFQ